MDEIIKKNTFGNRLGKGKKLKGNKVILDVTKQGQYKTTIPKTIAEMKDLKKGNVLKFYLNKNLDIVIKVEEKKV